MYGQFEVLRMVDELHHEELLANAQRYRLTKVLDDPCNKAIAKQPIRQWLGSRLVFLGCRLLNDCQPCSDILLKTRQSPVCQCQ